MECVRSVSPFRILALLPGFRRNLATSVSLIEEFKSADKKEYFSVDVDTLDETSNGFGQEPVSMVQIDVEGAAHLVLHGAGKTIERDLQIMFVRGSRNKQSRRT